MKKIISLSAAVVTLLFTFSATAMAFSDVTTSTAYSMEINWLSDNGVIRGYPDGTFKPNATVNRAEMLKIVFLALGLSAEVEAARSEMTQANIGFPDVKLDQWYAPYVYLAKKRGSVQGYPDGTFKPGNPVKRSEAFKIVLNEFYNNQVNFTGTGEATDVSSEAWFWKYANFAASQDLFDGSKFNGGLDMTRAVTSQLVYRTKAVKDHEATAYAVSLVPNIIAQTEDKGLIDVPTGTYTPHTLEDMLTKIEAALPGYAAVNIRQSGSYTVFFALDNETGNGAWYRLHLTQAGARAEIIFQSGEGPGAIDLAAVSTNKDELLVTEENGKVALINIASLVRTELGTFASAGHARYTMPFYATLPDHEYILLLDKIDNGIKVVDAVTKNIQTGTFVAGFFAEGGAGGGGLESGYDYFAMMQNGDSVDVIANAFDLNLSTMTKQ